MIKDRVNGDAPCKDCPDRYSGCHSKCDKYETWRSGHRKFLDNINKIRKDIREIDNALIKKRRKRW